MRILKRSPLQPRGILAASVLLALLLRTNSELNTTKDQLKASQAQGERLFLASVEQPRNN